MVVLTKSTKTAAELSTERVMKRRAARARLEALNKEPRLRKSFQHDARAKRSSRAHSSRIMMSSSFFTYPAPRPRASAEEEEEEEEEDVEEVEN